MAFEFVIIHRLAAMMQDVDGVSRHIDPLVYRYTITTSSLYAEDVTERLFAYSFDVFYRCNNPRNVTASDALSISITISINPSISLLFFLFALFFLLITKPLTGIHYPFLVLLLRQSLESCLIWSSILSPLVY